MTRDDIIAMVQEVIVTDSNDNPFDFRLTTVEQIERFAGLVAAAEREACVKVCEAHVGIWIIPAGPKECAAAIRARGQA